MTRAEQITQLVVDKALDAVVISNGGGRIVAWNRQAEAMFGRTAEEAVGLTMEETVVPPERHAAYRATLAQIAAAGGGFAGERREGVGLHRDGRRFPIEVSISALEFDDARLTSHFIRDLTAERQVATSLRTTDQLFRTLLDAMPLPVNIIDPDGKVLLWNKAAERLFGWSAEEALGRFVPSCPPANVADLEARQQRVFAGEMLVDQSARALLRDGSEIDVSLSVAPVYGGDGSIVGSMGISVDLTERNQIAERLAASNALLQAILDAAPLPITGVDLEGRATLWNKAAEREYGWSAGEVIGRALPVVPEDQLEIWNRRRERTVAGEALMDVEAQRLRRDGSRFDVSLSVAPIHGPAGQVVGTLGISMDITERKRTFDLILAGDQERRRLLAKLVRAQEEERQRVAGDIHDDSVQVLTALALRLEMIRRRLTDPDSLADLAEAERTARLAITRLRHLMFELRPPALDRDGLVAALRMQLEQATQSYGVEFSLVDNLDFEPEDETRALVYRVVQEAVVNAGKHARARSVEVEVGTEDGSVVARVTDDGCGFDSSREHDGHLGLVFMRERTDMAGGWCRIESAEGSGTVVEFSVPTAGGAQVAPR